jgi:drug/metabolite transporter (DMT)-like permease
VRAERPYAVLALAVAFISVGSIFVRMAHAPALAVAFNRIGLASLFVAPFSARALVHAWPALTVRQRGVLLASGISLGLHFATWIASLDYTSVAASVLLVNTTPLFTLGFSWWLLGERASAGVITAMAIALGGACLIAAGDWGQGAGSLKGDALATIGAATLSLYHVVGRGLRDALPLSAYVLGVWATAAATLALLAFAAQVPLVGYPPRTFAFFVALALVPTVLGHGLVNRSLRSIAAPTVGLFLLGEPIGASILAYLFFEEVPPPLTIAGGVLVLAALVLLVRSERT